MGFLSYSPLKSKAKRLTAELCGNIPIKALVKPIRPPGMASGEIATFHYGRIFRIQFLMYLYENGKGNLVLKYGIPKGDINVKFDETFDLEGRKYGFKNRAWTWLCVCKCKRKTRGFFMGWDNAILCRYCLHVRSQVAQTTTWKDVIVAKNPSQLKRLIYTSYTPYKKMRAIKIYVDFLKRMIKAIRSKNPGVYLKTMGR